MGTDKEEEQGQCRRVLGRHQIHIHRGGTAGIGNQERKEAKAMDFARGVENERPEDQMKATKTHSEENRKRYNKLTREIKKTAKQCKEQWLEGKCQEAEDSVKKQDTKRLYQMVKEICGTKTAAIKDKDGKLLESRTDIKNRWKEYFEKLYNKTNPVDKTILQEMPPCNRQEQEMMHTLCKRIYQEESCPADWGKAIIVPIHKNKDKRDCNNYRGISLLSVAGKVYTSIPVLYKVSDKCT